MQKFLLFLNNLGTIILVTSIASILNRFLDSLVEKAMAAYPASRFLKAIDKTLDVSDTVLQAAADALTKMVAKRNEVPK